MFLPGLDLGLHPTTGSHGTIGMLKIGMLSLQIGFISP